MLQVIDAAVSVLKNEILREGEPLQQREPATAVRVRPAVTADGRQTITLQPVMGPEPGDASSSGCRRRSSAKTSGRSGVASSCPLPPPEVETRLRARFGDAWC